MPGQAGGSHQVQAKFHIPNGWGKSGPGQFTLGDFKKAHAFWEEQLSHGHQPWRLEPASVAAACLWDFGIHDGGNDSDLANRLKVVKPGEVFRISIGSSTYTVTIKTERRIPIAVQVTVEK